MTKLILIIILILPAFPACNDNQKKNSETIATDLEIDRKKHPDSQPLDSLTQVMVKHNNKSTSLEDWQRFQDSIREIILSSKENEILKNSVLQEAYIKNIVWVNHDTLFFSIQFDLHGFDCGAPDCYSTDLNFKFNIRDSLRFPNKLPFTIHEHGCVKKEINLSAVFQLMESDKNFITYHSLSNKSTLVIFKSDDRGEFIYYFVGVEPETIKGKLVPKIIDAYEEENPKAIVPYRSVIMRNSDYGFIMTQDLKK